MRAPSDGYAIIDSRRTHSSAECGSSDSRAKSTHPPRVTPSHRVPLGIRLPFTAFVAVLVPTYLGAYGPTNFLYFCDVALLLTLVAVWLECPLLASMAMVGSLAPQALWVADFVANLLGYRLTGMTTYMFEARRPWFTRLLSLFHGWLPFLLVYLVWRLGYDRRAFVAWTIVSGVLLTVCYLWSPPPPAPPEAPDRPVNINYVFGLGDERQTWMPELAWYALLMVGLPVLVYAPTHFVLARVSPQRRRCFERTRNAA